MVKNGYKINSSESRGFQGIMIFAGQLRCYCQNYWGPMGKILPNGHLLSVWDGGNMNTRYGSVGVENVYLDGEEIGQIKHYSPLVISRDVEPFFDDIKSFNKLIASQASDGLKYDGAEYIIDDY